MTSRSERENQCYCSSEGEQSHNNEVANPIINFNRRGVNSKRKKESSYGSAIGFQQTASGRTDWKSSRQTSTYSHYSRMTTVPNERSNINNNYFFLGSILPLHVITIIIINRKQSQRDLIYERCEALLGNYKPFLCFISIFGNSVIVQVFTTMRVPPNNERLLATEHLQT